ncbi:MAG TPA: hypothetical protein VD862_00815 [Candidatus Paceibacterota bacterium]|nr:hypothetical protein [Candidatus Paceibacterota bacterium]
MTGFSAAERSVLRGLTTPAKVQDFLDRLRYSFDRGHDRLRSPRRILRERSAHCIEGAMLAAAAFWVRGGRPLLMDLRSSADDLDHVVALFRRHGRWGAVSKTNHVVLRYREPVYRTVRELALSYFNEYFLDDGRKTMRDFSGPYDLVRHHGTAWMTGEDDLWGIAEALDAVPHTAVLPRGIRLRKADPIERRAARLEQYPYRKRRLAAVRREG